MRGLMAVHLAFPHPYSSRLYCGRLLREFWRSLGGMDGCEASGGMGVHCPRAGLGQGQAYFAGPDPGTLSTVQFRPMWTEVQTEPNPQVLGSVPCEGGPDPYLQVRGPGLSGPDLRVEPSADLVRTSIAEMSPLSHLPHHHNNTTDNGNNSCSCHHQRQRQRSQLHLQLPPPPTRMRTRTIRAAAAAPTTNDEDEDEDNHSCCSSHHHQQR